MKYALTSILSTAAVCAFGCAGAAPTPAYALVRDEHAKAERAQHHPTPYPPHYGYTAYPPGYSAYVPGGAPVGGLHHPTGCANCPPQ